MVRWSVRVALALWLLAVIAWASLHWLIVPRIDDFRPRVQQLAARTVGAPVVLGALRAESNGLVASISVADARVLDATGQPALELGRMLATVSIGSLLRGELAQLVVDRLDLQLRRDAQGRLWLGGLPLDTGADPDPRGLDWLFAQGEILLRDGRLQWIDEQQGGEPLQLEQIELALQNDGRRHQFRLDATPDPAWGERFTLIGQLRQPLLVRHEGDWRSWSGQLHAELPRVDLQRWSRLTGLAAERGIELQAGAGALRLWLEVAHGAAIGATLDAALAQFEATLGPGLAPLQLAPLQGRLEWREHPEGGFELGTRGLQFSEADGTVWPGGNFHFRRGPTDQALRADRLDLAALVRLADRLPLPAELREPLQAQPISGRVEELQAHWSGELEAPTDWRLQGRVSGVAVGARPAEGEGEPGFHPGVPGIDGATLALDAGPAGGQASLEIHDGALEFPGVFEQPRIALAELTAQARWQVEGERIVLEVPSLTLRNDDASGRFQARWHTGEDEAGSGPRLPGTLDLQGAFSRANAAAVHRYLPLSLPAEARHYVRDAIRQGEGRDIAVQVKGRLHEVPFNHPGEVGEFRFAGPVSGVTMAYVPRALQPAGEPAWPPLEALAGELVFERAGMQVHGSSAAVQGHPDWRFADIEAEIADFKHAVVKVRAEGRGALDAALGIVRTSPVAGYTQHALDQASGTQAATLGLELELPLAQIEQSRVRGQVRLDGNDLRLAPGVPLLAQARGGVRFSEQGFSIENGRATALGGEVALDGGTRSEDAAAAAPVLVQARGTASAAGLREMTGWGPVAALARHGQGSASYVARIGFHGAVPEIEVETDLQGLALTLPAPLAKAADERWPLRYESGPLPSTEGPARERLHLRVAELLALDYETTADTPARVLRGALALGAPALQALALPEQGVRAWVDLPELDVDALLALREEAAGDASTADASGVVAAREDDDFLPTHWSVRVDQLRAGARRLHLLGADITRERAHWRANVHARELDGRIEYIGGAGDDPGTLRARLARLQLAGDEGEPEGQVEDPAASQPPGRLPALDVVVEDFELRGKPLGRLEVQAVNREQAAHADRAREWQLSRLALVTPQAQLAASGRWLTRKAAAAGPAASQQTTLDFRLDIEDGGKLLERLGMAEVLRRGQGQIEGQLSWAGSPTSPHYPSMDGRVHLDVASGQFLKAEPGVAKLLGVLSLQALPRRLALDFRDVFSSGFAFDFLRGDAQVRRGVAHTENLQMKGVNAAVLMDGEVDLAQETQRLRVLVVPEIDAGTAALAAALINPAIGIGAFVAQLVLKGPLAQATTREFRVTGSWDNPEIEPVQASSNETAPEGESR